MVEVGIALVILSMVSGAIVYFHKQLSDLRETLRTCDLEQNEDLDSLIKEITGTLMQLRKEFDEFKLINKHDMERVNLRITSLKKNAIRSDSDLSLRLDNLESFAEKHNHYSKRTQNKHSRSFETMSNGEDDWNTGILKK